MSFGDEAVPEEEPVSSEGEAAPAEANGSAAPAAEHAGPAEEADPREVLARERDEYLLALQRTQADFENYRKRITRQQEEQAARASQHLVDKLLPVLDALDLAENHLKESLDVSEGAKALHALAGDAAGHPLEGRPRAGRPARGPLRPLGARRASRTPTARAVPAARPWWRRCCAPATAGRGRCCVPPWSACGGELTHGRTA